MFNRTLIIILSVLNVTILTLYVVTINEQHKETAKYDRIKEDILSNQVYDLQREEARIKINRNMIENIIIINNNKHKIFVSNYVSENDSNTILFYFIPPNPCGVCIDNDLDYFMDNDFSLKQFDRLVILSPEYRTRDIRAKLFNKKYDILSYDTNDLTYSHISSLESSILFTSIEGSIDNIFISKKNNYQYTLLYLDIVNKNL